MTRNMYVPLFHFFINHHHHQEPHLHTQQHYSDLFTVHFYSFFLRQRISNRVRVVYNVINVYIYIYYILLLVIYMRF